MPTQRLRGCWHPEGHSEVVGDLLLVDCACGSSTSSISSAIPLLMGRDSRKPEAQGGDTPRCPNGGLSLRERNRNHAVKRNGQVARPHMSHVTEIDAE